MGDGIYQFCFYTHENLTKLISVNHLSLAVSFTVSTLWSSSSSSRLHFTLFNIFCPGNILVTNQISGKVTFWSDFPEFRCVELANLYVFFNVIIPYRVFVSRESRIFAEIGESLIPANHPFDLSIPSLLRIENVPCSAVFTISINSTVSNNDTIFTEFFPDLSIPHYDFSDLSPTLDVEMDEEYGGIREGYIVATIVVSMIAVCVVFEVFLSRKKRRVVCTKRVMEESHDPSPEEFETLAEPTPDFEVEIEQIPTVVQDLVVSNNDRIESEKPIPDSPYDTEVSLG
jgi:hypothetical protein